MSFPTAIARAYAKILSFNGRASRTEFWSFYAFQVLVAGGIAYWLYYKAGLAQVMPLLEGRGGMLVGAVILTQLPGLSLIVRRLHDSGRSAWWMLITLVPVLGALALFVLLIQPSAPQVNRYDAAAQAPRQTRAPQPAPRRVAKLATVPATHGEQRAEVMALYKERISSLSKTPHAQRHAA